MLGELIDRALAPFAPTWALQRSWARADLKTYQAASRDRRNRDWPTDQRSADAAIIPDAIAINARARGMIRDSHVAKAIVRAKVRNIVGRGVTPIPVATALAVGTAAGVELTDLNRAAEREFLAWANDPKRCDAEGRRTFWALQRLAIAETVAVGEAFFIKSYIPGVGLQLRAYEAEQLDDTIRQCGNNEVRGGVEVDPGGRAVAYHFWARNRNDFLPLRNLKSQRFEAERVIHYYNPERVMQARGVSDLAPVLQRIRDVHRRDEAELMKAIMEACHGVSVIRDRGGRKSGAAAGLPRAPGDAAAATVGQLPKFEYAPGMVFEGGPGDEIKFHSPTTPGNSYEPFARGNLRAIGAGVGLSYEQVSRDFSQASWSSQRQALLEDRREWNPEIDHLIDTLIAPTYEMWFCLAVLEGQLPLSPLDYAKDPKRYSEAEYVPDGHEWVDPEKEVGAIKEALELDILTRKEVIGRRGGRLRKTLEQIKSEKDLAKSLGITFAEDQAAAAAGGPPGAPPIGGQSAVKPPGPPQAPAPGGDPPGQAATPATLGSQPSPDDDIASLGWITKDGGHVLIGDDGEIKGGKNKGAKIGGGSSKGGDSKSNSKGPAKASEPTQPASKSGGFPSLGDLNEVKPLGGSTGAKLVKDGSGRQYVMKTGTSPDHLRSEFAAEEMYRAMGVPVPASKLYDGPSPVKLSEFADGKTLGELNGTERAAAEKQVADHFAAHALMGNWDAIGSNADNVLVGKDGAMSIDTGGALAFRAQGAPKGAAWNGKVSEIDTLRDPAINPQAAKVFGQLSDADIKQQVSDLVKKKDKILAATPQELRPVMEERLNTLESKFLHDDFADVSPENHFDPNTIDPAGAPKPPAAVKPPAAKATTPSMPATPKAPKAPPAPKRLATEEEWHASLSPAETASIKSWSGSTYESIRQFQMHGPPPDHSADVANIEAALARGPIHKGEVFRGIRDLPPDVAERLSKPGETINMQGTLASWSKDPAVAEDFSDNLQGASKKAIIFHVAKNKSGVDIQNVSVYGGKESEILLPSKVQYRVKSSTVRPDGKIMVELEELTPKSAKKPKA